MSDKFKFNFGSALATYVTCASDTRCTMTVPAHAPGTVDVIVETVSGKTSAVPADQFKYLAPVITGISPSVGPTAGGQGVTLTGVGLDS